ncbi:MAG: hypothetical protein IT357_03640 [Gemmatimonadaceae bacterium]|nr:hypothetical protein [Gemmatimonadaceae bacterium]
MSRLVRVVLLVGGITDSAAAQNMRNPFLPDLSDPTTRACVATLDSSRFESQVVSLMTMERRNASTGANTAAFLMVEDLGNEVRRQLGASEGQVPQLRGQLPWTALWGSMMVVLEPSGRAQAIPRVILAAEDSLAEPGSALLRRALQQLVDSGSVWPYDALLFVRDTVLITFEFPGAIDQPQFERFIAIARVNVPVFGLRAPRQRPVNVDIANIKDLPPYPREARRAGAFADVLVRFNFDARGRPIANSLVEVAPSGRDELGPFDITVVAGAISINEATTRFNPHPATATERASFFETLRKSVPKLAFSPGYIGECALPRRVTMRFSFRMP